jgi:5'-nucleotidase/UDP-sugar diphosphatase
MRIIFLTLAFISLFGCSSPSPSSNNIKYLTVLHTNDNHGRFWHNEEGEYGMSARKTLIDQLRFEAKQQGHAVLLLSGGDINTGIPESDLQQAEPDFKGMSLLGYDAMALGNHEFDNPISVLKKQQQWANFPFLSANIFDKESGGHAFDSYKIFKKNGLTIAVIGLTTTDTAKIGNPQYISHLDFKDPITVTRTLSDEIKKKYNPDITIALTHMGHFVDAKFGINAPGDVTLARSLPINTLDMIIGGHSQEPVCMSEKNVNDDNFKPGLACNPDQQNGTWIMQAHEWGKYVGKAEFKLEKGELTLLSYKLLPVNLYVDEQQNDGSTKRILANEYIAPDPAMYSFLKVYQDKGAKQIEGKIGALEGRLEGDRSKVRYVQTNLARVIIQAQMDIVNADFGVISGGGIRSSINAGDVSYKDILKVHPFKNRITYMDWNGEDLWQYLNIVTRFPADAGAYLQYHKLAFELINGELKNVLINGKPLDKSKTYRMSINSYNASGGDGFPALTNKDGFTSTGHTDVEALTAFFKAHNPVKAAEFMPK